MIASERKARVIEMMAQQGIDLLICASNGFHTIDWSNPVGHMTGFRSLDLALYLLRRDGSDLLLAGRNEPELPQRNPAAEYEIVDDFVVAIMRAVKRLPEGACSVGTVGFGDFPHRLAEQIETVLPTNTRALDDAFNTASGPKTGEEIAHARRATQIAELGYRRLLEWAKPGMPECDLVVKLNLYMRECGANDAFTLISAAPLNSTIMPSSERMLSEGDLVMIELSPSYRGQFVQICRTVTIGQAKARVRENYQLLVDAMLKGIAAARPGVTVGAVCEAINSDLSARGFTQYSSPPFIRRRGHGLGSGSIWPGDVATDNQTVLREGALFMVHPNQFLPESGYMMCGEPILITASGAEILTARHAQLDSILL